MDFFDNVVNKSNAILKDRLNNPFGQRQQSQDQTATSDAQQDPTSSKKDTISQKASTSSGVNGDPSANEDIPVTGSATDQDKNSQFAAIAADAEAVAQKAAKGAQKFGTFLFSMANKAGQTVSQTAKQVKQAVESNSILTDFTREQQEFIRQHGGSMQAADLPWILSGSEANLAGEKVEERQNYLKEQILSLSQDKRNFVRSPPKNSDYQFEPQKFYPVALSLLKEDSNLNKMRYELVPKLVNEDTFWCNYFYRVEMLRKERGKMATGDTGWASSRSSSGEGPDEITTSQRGDLQAAGGHSIAESEAQTQASYSNQTLAMQDTLRGGASNMGNETRSERDNNTTAFNPVDEFTSFESGDSKKVVSTNDDDLKERLRELNIGSFDGGQDANNEEDDDEWDEELQREFELVSGDLSGFEEEEDLKNDLLDIERSKSLIGNKEAKK